MTLPMLPLMVRGQPVGEPTRPRCQGPQCLNRTQPVYLVLRTPTRPTVLCGRCLARRQQILNDVFVTHGRCQYVAAR
jgi:hypothetical protein